MHIGIVENNPTVLTMVETALAPHRSPLVSQGGRLVRIWLGSSRNLSEHMQNFPLESGESCFPSMLNPQVSYVYLRRLLLSMQQVTWLLAHKLAWEYL